MPWALISLLALVLATGAPSAKVPAKILASKDAAASAASTYAPSPMYDAEAEQQLLEMANQARAAAGAPLLTADPGLVLAARAHAEAMAQQQQLSHQLSGEPSLVNRVSSASELHLDGAGENVAADFTAAEAHEHLMLSPPHRENLLNSGYNVAGFGVVRAGDRMWVVEDFGHSLPILSGAESGQMILAGLNQLRRQSEIPDLVAVDQPGLREAVCSMALEGRLTTQSMRDFSQRYTVLSYTNMHPELLPAGTARLLADRRLSHTSVSVCYARTSSYPNGTYWVGILLY